MIKITTKSGKVIKMDIANAYNKGGNAAAMAMMEAAMGVIGNEKVVSMEQYDDEGETMAVYRQ